MRGPGNSMGAALKGLTDRQRLLIKTYLADNGVKPLPGSAMATVVLSDDHTVERSITLYGAARKGDTTLEGGSIYRAPTTIDPPTTLRLHKRDAMGKLQQVIVITERGVTK